MMEVALRWNPKAIVHASWGRWAAKCPRPYCYNAEAFGWDMHGLRGGLGETEFRCREEMGGCGLRCQAVWPPNVRDIEWALMQRPMPSTRNWIPGEQLIDLIEENIAHGIQPMSQEALEDPTHPSVPLLKVSGDEIEGGPLSIETWRTEVGGINTPEWRLRELEGGQ